MIASMVLVVIFMLVYYRFSGIVACLREQLTLAMMIVISAHAPGSGGSGADDRHGGRRQRADLRADARGIGASPRCGWRSATVSSARGVRFSIEQITTIMTAVILCHRDRSDPASP